MASSHSVWSSHQIQGWQRWLVHNLSSMLNQPRHQWCSHQSKRRVYKTQMGAACGEMSKKCQQCQIIWSPTWTEEEKTNSTIDGFFFCRDRKRQNEEQAWWFDKHRDKKAQSQSNLPTAKRVVAKSCEGVLLNAHPGGTVSDALQLYYKCLVIPVTLMMQMFGATSC